MLFLAEHIMLCRKCQEGMRKCRADERAKEGNAVSVGLNKVFRRDERSSDRGGKGSERERILRLRAASGAPLRKTRMWRNLARKDEGDWSACVGAPFRRSPEDEANCNLPTGGATPPLLSRAAKGPGLPRPLRGIALTWQVISMQVVIARRPACGPTWQSGSHRIYRKTSLRLD